MSKIYAVGVMQLDFDTGRTASKRLWYFYKNFEDAERGILENHSDIFEYYYNVALIEEHILIDGEGSDSDTFGNWQQWWYQATYLETGDGDLKIERIETPICFQQICCLWAG